MSSADSAPEACKGSVDLEREQSHRLGWAGGLDECCACGGVVHEPQHIPATKMLRPSDRAQQGGVRFSLINDSVLLAQSVRSSAVGPQIAILGGAPRSMSFAPRRVRPSSSLASAYNTNGGSGLARRGTCTSGQRCAAAATNRSACHTLLPSATSVDASQYCRAVNAYNAPRRQRTLMLEQSHVARPLILDAAPDDRWLWEIAWRQRPMRFSRAEGLGPPATLWIQAHRHPSCRCPRN